MPAQLTKKEAIWFYKEGKWKHWSDVQIVDFQLYQEKLCMDWAPFHDAVTSVLNRSVWSCEFIGLQLLQVEYEKRSRRAFIKSSAVMLLMIVLLILGLS